MKAGPVSGLDPSSSFQINAALVVRKRLEELRELAPLGLDTESIRHQHDARIAAKRLRYALEIGKSCFGSEGDDARILARDLQTTLGDMRDCDLLMSRTREEMVRIEDEDVTELISLRDTPDALGAEPPDQVQNSSAYQGLSLLVVHLRARRGLLHDHFAAVWRSDRAHRVWTELESRL